MTLKLDDWLPTAKTLASGASVKIPHPGCSSSPALKVTHGLEGFQAYCFKCHSTGFHAHTPTSIIQYLDRKKVIEANRVAKLHRDHGLPADFSHNLPLHAIQWLRLNGLSETLCTHYRVGWSEQLQRIILPLVGFIGWTGRGLTKDMPKYIERIKPGCIALFPALDQQKKDVLIVVEDYASAAVCSQVTDSVALLGTSAPASLLSLCLKYSRVILWLDHDRAGRHGTAKVGANIRLVAEVQIVCTDMDPKKYSKVYISNLIRG